jgi:hypothetical protein
MIFRYFKSHIFTKSLRTLFNLISYKVALLNFNLNQAWAHIFSCVQPFYEGAVSNLA